MIFKNKTYDSCQDLLDKEYKDKPITILTNGERNAKLVKGITKKADVMILHFLPHNRADVLMDRKVKRTMCPFAIMAQCHEACLNTAGRGGIIKKGETTNTIEIARLRRTLLFLDEREEFLAQLHKEITAFVIRCKKNDKKPCVRLNGTSDIQYEYELHEGKNMFEHFPEVQFYDYTANPVRLYKDKPDNYHITFSRKENNDVEVEKALTAGYNVAVAFDKLPATWKGLPVIDGDKTDLRFLDPKGCIVGLKAKGKGKTDPSGFIIHTVSSQYDGKSLAALRAPPLPK